MGTNDPRTMAQQSETLKILAIGAPLSAISTFVQKVNAINSKHGPFDCCVAVGDFFDEGSDGTEIRGLTFPLPTYFTLGQYELPHTIKDSITETGGLVAPNLIFLGKAGILTTAQGLKIACVGGKYDAETYDSDSEPDALSPLLTKHALASLLANPLLAPVQASSESLANSRTPSNGIDLLILTNPPPSLHLLSPSFSTLNFTLADQVHPFVELVQRAKPRYMFWSAGEGFWEREPFAWEADRVTRAVKLGRLGGDQAADAGPGGKRARWHYAFTLPVTPAPKPPNCTPNPYVLAAPNKSVKRAALQDQNSAFGKKGKVDNVAPPDDYICKICSMPGHWISECPKRQHPDKPPPGYVCKVCQSSEHYIRECPERAAQDATRGRGVKSPPDGYVCKACGAEKDHFIRDCPTVMERERDRAKRTELGPAECWFCLSNPKVTKHLIVGIGAETYVTLPKGQLIPTGKAKGDSLEGVPGGGHVLIIPIAHHPTLLSIPEEDAMTLISELESYKSALRKLYAAHDCVPVAFEVGRLSGRGGHAHVQVVPVPKALGGKVRTAFEVEGARMDVDWEMNPDKALERAGAGGNYFRVDLPDGTKMVHMLKGRFDLQFGRIVLANLMGLAHRIDWKAVPQSIEEEKADARDFKKAFKPYDPAAA